MRSHPERPSPVRSALRAVETQFAIDSTGFATSTYVRWFDHKYGQETKRQQWVKAHAMIGTKTNVVTAVALTEGSSNDSPELEALVRKTHENGFDIREVSADKAYLSNDNLNTIQNVGAVPYIPMKSNSRLRGGTEAWRRLWHMYSYRREEFLPHYHRRSNVESTFSSIKRKFGGSVRSKLPVAQFNEVLLKCLCHNLSMLVHSFHELGIEPQFNLAQGATP